MLPLIINVKQHKWKNEVSATWTERGHHVSHLYHVCMCAFNRQAPGHKPPNYGPQGVIPSQYVLVGSAPNEDCPQKSGTSEDDQRMGLLSADLLAGCCLTLACGCTSGGGINLWCCHL